MIFNYIDGAASDEHAKGLNENENPDLPRLYVICFLAMLKAGLLI